MTATNYAELVSRLRSKNCCDAANCNCDASADAILALQREVEWLNQWADGFSDAQLKERREAELLLKELRARIATLSAEVMHYTAGTPHPLEAEVARFKHVNPEDYPEFVLSQEVTRLRAEIAGLRKDAERYRWVRERSWCGPGTAGYDPTKWDVGDPRPETLDAHIDAAIGEGGPSAVQPLK